MADKKEIIGFLEALGFTSKNRKQFLKTYKLQNYTIKADVEKNKILYRTKDQTTVERQEDGQIQLGDKTTSNFIHPENFVVLECVDRLLNKGYLPNDIHLERRYPSGRGASGGKSDVCVYGKDGKSLLVIECKTWGSEFEKEKKKMEEHGGQLFAYLANDQNAKFLVLYASRLNDAIFDYENLIVQVKDREEDIAKSTKQIEEEGIKLYRDAKNKGELYEVWKESFSLYFHFNGIFDDDANAYSLELKALKKKNLKPLDDSQGLFNKFAEILRHNNISDNANAFNKILSLFLCKIVDEEKKDEDILDFQVKEDEEYEHLIDRLQALYYKGMKKLNEEIVYYSEKDLHQIIKLYPKQTPIEQVEDIFRQLKYYTSNEFAFKEVHNKKLFIQNGRVLTEIVKLLQNFRFRYNSQQQVLGDFFELMLNHGVKQSEGQFFTPIPIVRFIILSLGFETLVHRKLVLDDEFILPKILDYACGAGHFLTESIEELQNILKEIDESELNAEQKKKVKDYRLDTTWAKQYIFGIEKDYRLARTSQIACFLNGDGDANIIFGDGLEDHNLNLDKKQFDVVIANPPYSVEAFKNYLNVGKTHFDLFNHITERGSQIEALFVERTKQVLAVGGVAGIILPSQILNVSGVYIKAREVLLKYFEIKGITELGNKTFIATGQSTVILFLKRRSDDFVKDREYLIEDLFNNTKRTNELTYLDSDRLLKLYTDFREIKNEDYKEFLATQINKSLSQNPLFKEYQEVFQQSSELDELKKKNTFKKLKPTEQKNEVNKLFYNYCKSKEKELLLYFLLCLGDGHKDSGTIEEYYKPQKTIVVKTGNDVSAQKSFLGYEIKGGKGQEGIKILNYGGSLFDNSDYFNKSKANSYIRANISNSDSISIDASIEESVSQYDLIDLIDFDRVNFEKIIKTHSSGKVNVTSKWSMSKLSEIVTINKETFDPKNFSGNTFKYIDISSVQAGTGVVNFENEINKKEAPSRARRVIQVGDILLSTVRPNLKSFAYLDKLPKGNILASTGFAVITVDGKKIEPIYLYELLFSEILQKQMRAAMPKGLYPSINQNDIANFKVPLPPLKTQKEIVKALSKIQDKIEKSKQEIIKLENEIVQAFKNAYNSTSLTKIGKVCKVQSGGTPKRDIPEYWNGNINWLRSEVCQNVFVSDNSVIEKITDEGLKNSSAKLLEKDTVLIALVGATIGKVAYLTFASTTNQNVAGIKPIDEQVLLPKYLFYALITDYNKNFGDRKGKFTMANLSMIRNIEISIPSINMQKEIIDIIDKKENQIKSIKDGIVNVQDEKETVLKKYLD